VYVLGVSYGSILPIYIPIYLPIYIYVFYQLLHTYIFVTTENSLSLTNFFLYVDGFFLYVEGEFEQKGRFRLSRRCC